MSPKDLLKYVPSRPFVPNGFQMSRATDLIEAVLSDVPVSMALDSICESICEAVDKAELVRTAYSLVKRNKGNWKSDKQALFLLDTATQLSKMVLAHDSGPAKDWLRKKGYKTDTLVALAWSQRLKGYGTRDPSKVRYSGTVVAFDEVGVVLIGTVKVVHQKKYVKQQKGSSLDFGRVTVKYERPKSHKPTVVVNYYNRPVDSKTIEVIKGIPGYQYPVILVSFLNQLNDHKKLSPKQMVTLNTFLPAPRDTGVGTKEDLQKELEMFFQVIRTKCLPVVVEASKEFGWRHTLSDIQKDWVGFEKGSKYDFSSSIREVQSLIVRLFENASGRPKKLYGQTFLHDIRDKVKRAIKVKVPGKSHVEAISDMKWLNKALESASVSKMRTALQLD